VLVGCERNDAGERRILGTVATGAALETVAGGYDLAYDGAGRLVVVSAANRAAAEYVYDPAGNLLEIRRLASGDVSVIGFSPDRGSAGESVTVFGAGFDPTPSLNSVNLSGMPVTVLSATSTELTFEVPSGATTGHIAVTTGRNTGTSADVFTVLDVPGAPGTPTYTAVTASSLNVNWTAATDAVFYEVERAPDASGAPGTWTQIASALTALTYYESGLVGNTSYWYRVRANAGGDGPSSSQSMVVTLPSAPGTPAFSDIGSPTVTVSWTAPAGGAASYKVERGASQYGPWTQIASGVTALSYTDSSVSPNVTYWYQVRATNTGGLDGNYSSAASVTTAVDPEVAVPGAPGAPTYDYVTTAYLCVIWTEATGAVSYKVERAPDASGAPGSWTQIAASVTSLWSCDSGVAGNTSYWYRVRATNAGGDGPYSTSTAVMTGPIAPGTPTFTDVGEHTVTVNWTASAGGAASYKVERAALGSSFTQVAAGLTSPVFTDTELDPNVTYSYRVRATNAMGIDGYYSSITSVITAVDPGIGVPGAPGAPTYTYVSASSLSVNWTAVAGAVSYKVERAPDASGAPGAWTQIATSVTSLWSFDPGLAGNTSYWYRVRATNSGGDGPYSPSTVAMTAPNVPGAPTFGGVGQRTVTVSWTASAGGAASYKVERARLDGSFAQIAAGVTNLVLTDTGLDPSVTYSYRVRATNQ
jgi:YD repeat-containing protein